MDKISYFAQNCWRYLCLVARRFMDDGCQHSAAALTYMSLFAVVPMMTVTFSMFSLVPAFQGVGDQVQELIFKNFLPSVGAEVQTYLEDFSASARKLSAVGVIILVVTAYLMLHNIESVFNRIWKTTGPRRGVTAFLLYWAVLSLGPLLLGTAMLMNTYLLSMRMFNDQLAQSALNLLFGYLPWLLTATAFTLLYMVVPNCKVALRNAVTGGVVATLAFEIAKAAFGYFVANSSYTSIYGAFATIPIFLLWIYLLWMIVLGGAEFVRATESFKAETREQLPTFMAVVYLMWIFWCSQKKGVEVSDDQCRCSGLTGDHWSEIRDQLLKHRLISLTESGNYVLLKSANQIYLRDLKMLFQSPLRIPEQIPHNDAINPVDDWWPGYIDIVKTYQAQTQDTFNMSLDELFQSSSESKKLA